MITLDRFKVEEVIQEANENVLSASGRAAFGAQR
jgi:hypothetical protein